MKKLVVMTLSFILALTIVACGGVNDTPEADDTSYLSVEINPGIEFILNDEGDVESVLPVNEHAEAVIADLDLVGLPADEALEAFIDAAIETGYIDVDSNENIVTVTSNDEEEQETKKAEVEAILEERAIGAAIFGGEMNETYATLAEEHDVSVGRARLISRAVEISDELETFEDGLELEHSEIVSILIDEHRTQMDAFIENRQAEALEMKNNMIAMAQEKVEAHREAVEQGEVDIPDFDTIRNDVEENIDEIRSQYENRIQQKRQDAEDFIPEGTD